MQSNLNLSERGAISPERDEIVDERGAELSGAIWSDFERWSEHPRERGAEILTAQLRSHALVCSKSHSNVNECGGTSEMLWYLSVSVVNLRICLY